MDCFVLLLVLLSTSVLIKAPGVDYDYPDLNPDYAALKLRLLQTTSTQTTPLTIETTTPPSNQTEEISYADKLMEGLKELLVTGKFSDVILNVKGEKFSVHKNILAIHSPVFASMMEHDIQEHANSTVNIDSSEPDIFTDFLHFMYYGSTQNINLENVVDLYILADKYQVTELNKVCVTFMMNHISVESFCDIMSLAIRFHEKELSEVTTQYFLKYWTDVAKTPKWLIFLKENLSAGNELFLKALSLKT